MKKLAILLVGLLVLMASGIILLRSRQVSAEGKNDFVKGEVLVKFNEGVAPKEAGQVHQRLGGRVKETIPGINVQIVAVNRGVGEVISAYKKEKRVEYAEPNYIAYALGIPDDTYFVNQWGMHNNGQTGGLV
ncbi:MAG: hypothetical protein ABII08_04725, partial [Candidatus Beckwithbacteria bacterium]